MATNIFLGYPPENIRTWIEKNYEKKEENFNVKIILLDNTEKNYVFSDTEPWIKNGVADFNKFAGYYGIKGDGIETPPNMWFMDVKEIIIKSGINHIGYHSFESFSGKITFIDPVLSWEYTTIFESA